LRYLFRLGGVFQTGEALAELPALIFPIDFSDAIEPFPLMPHGANGLVNTRRALMVGDRVVEIVPMRIGVTTEEQAGWLRLEAETLMKYAVVIEQGPRSAPSPDGRKILLPNPASAS
jgi:hypothetical protein